MFEGLGINGSCLCWIDDYTMESWLIASFERDFSLDFEYLLYLDEEWWLFDFDFSLGFGSASLIKETDGLQGSDEFENTFVENHCSWITRCVCWWEREKKMFPRQRALE